MRKDMETIMYSPVPEEFGVNFRSEMDAREMGFELLERGKERIRYELITLDERVGISRTTSPGHRYLSNETPLLDQCVFLVTVKRGVVSECRGVTLPNTKGQSLLLPPGLFPSTELPDPSGTFEAVTTAVLAEPFCETLADFGYDPGDQLNWASPVHVTNSSAGKLWSDRLKSYVDDTFDGFAEPGTMLPRSDFQACVSGYLLELFTSLLAAEGVLREQADTVAGRAEQIVRTARAYMEHYFGSIVSMKEVADACGITLRRLQQAFAVVENTRPHAVLTQIRLNAARDQLRTSRSETTVTDVALACGFTHLGRFSGAFRELFGQRPSDVSGQS